MCVPGDWKFYAIIGLVGIALVAFPFLYAATSGGDGQVFGGFLINPLDGNSYLAKMYAGWAGAWRYDFPYTPESSRGAAVFLFYIFLGHIARLLHSPLLLIFHAARLLATIWMYYALYHFIRSILQEPNSQRWAFFLAVFGSGMGWVALVFGSLTPDFWVAEGYPFLSALANPHFPLSTGLILFLLLPQDSTTIQPPWNRIRRMIATVCLALFLAVISPFGVVIVLLVLAGQWAIECLAARRVRRSQYLSRLIAIGLAAAPLLLYYAKSTNSDPVLKGWNVQNLTPSPPIWELAIAYSPAALLALIAVVGWIRRKDPGRVEIVWVVGVLVMLYLPLGLQRRFLIAYQVPVVILAVQAVRWLVKSGKSFIPLALTVAILALPTNLIVLSAIYQGIQKQDASIYLSRAELQAFQWIEANTLPGSIILTAPGTGIFIPAYTGRRVVYGHPYETVNAEQRKREVEKFFQTTYIQVSNPLLQQVDYIFYGPRERLLSTQELAITNRIIFQNDEVRIYQARP